MILRKNKSVILILILYQQESRFDEKFSTFIFKVGSSYSAEDLALQTVKYGAKQVICTYRTQPMGFKWPPEITERPIFTHVAGKTVHFSGKVFFAICEMVIHMAYPVCLIGS